MYQRRLCMVALALSLLFATGASAVVVKGLVRCELWYGGALDNNLDNLKADARFPNTPGEVRALTAMDLPDQPADYFGARITGWLIPAQSGDFTFWTASDDDSEVWLSTDDTAANAKMICNVEGWMGYQDWTYTSGAPGTTYKSAPITLEAGKKYYIQALMADGTGGGFVSVAWAGPGIGANPTVIAGTYLEGDAPESAFLANSPTPANGAVDVTDVMVSWVDGINAKSDQIYFGTDPALGVDTFQGKQSSAKLVFVYPDELVPGATYYWRIDTTDTSNVVHTGNVWSFTVMPAKATEPSPMDKAKGTAATLTLTWKAGQNLPTHTVFLGKDKAAVEAGDASVQVAVDLMDATLDVGPLDFDTTYYWRVDELDIMGTPFVGDVWSFTTTLETLGKIKREIWDGISGTAVSDLTNNPNFPLKPTTTDLVPSFKSPDLGKDNYGGRMSAWLHVPTDGDYTFWIASDDASQLFFGATPGTAVQIASVAGWAGVDAWDSNASQKSAVQTLKAGVYFIDALWKEGGGGDNCSVAWQGPDIPRQAIPAGYCELFTGYWTQAPNPANGATGVTQNPTLKWAPGVKAAKHNVYFGDTLGGVRDATASSSQFKGSLNADVLTYTPAGPLTWDKVYYWRVDEVNDAEKGSPWKGAVWSFTVAGYLFINNTQQALYYNNAASPFFSELAYTVPANWTVNKTQALSLEFQGAAAAAAAGSTTVDGPGAYTLSGSGSDIWGTSDQFQFGYMKLTGDGSITAKIESVEQKNVWSKGGVMIRQSVNGNSPFAFMFFTGGGAGTAGGCNFQWRNTAGASAAPDGQSGPGITTPYWVRLERAGNTFSAFISPDGATWTQQGPSHDVVMADPVFIGLAYTSHVNATTFGTAKFTGVSVAGGVDPTTAANADVGLGNSAQPIYVAVQDAAGKVAIATYPNPAATTLTNGSTGSWTSWKIMLSDLAGVDLANVAKLFIGVGDSLAPKVDGIGVIQVRNVRVVKAVALASPISSVVRAKGTSGDRSPCGAFDGSRAPLGMQAGGLRDGNFVYSDRDYPWNQTPTELIGAAYVRMFNTDKGTADGTYTVTLSRAATVMVFHDDRNTPDQAAVDKVTAAFAAAGTFVNTGVDVFVYESATTPARPLSVFAADLPAGAYVFATESSGNTHYVIAAKDSPVADITHSADNIIGIPTNSNWPTGEYPRLVIDNSSSTKFLHFSGATVPTGFQVQPFFGTTIVTGLTFTSANDSPERDPVKFELSGSNDSITGPWTVIAAGDIVDFAGATTYPRSTKGTTPITFENTTAYKFYQVMFPACRGPNQNSMQVAEVELLGVLAK